jgi:hypothetical protein
MNTTYAQCQTAAQKKDASNAASVLDSSAQSDALQRKADMTNAAAQREEAPRPNNTGMPDNLKAGIESLSGFSMDDVRVHYNSSKPATVQALAYTQGTDIHVAPGQEKCLPHEAWHVAQQMAGRVLPTTNINGMPVNDNAGLEHEADVMGEKAVNKKNDSATVRLQPISTNCLLKKSAVLQMTRYVFYDENNFECLSDEKKKDRPATELAGWMKEGVNYKWSSDRSGYQWFMNSAKQMSYIYNVGAKSDFLPREDWVKKHQEWVKEQGPDCAKLGLEVELDRNHEGFLINVPPKTGPKTSEEGFPKTKLTEDKTPPISKEDLQKHLMLPLIKPKLFSAETIESIIESTENFLLIPSPTADGLQIKLNSAKKALSDAKRQELTKYYGILEKQIKEIEEKISPPKIDPNLVGKSGTSDADKSKTSDMSETPKSPLPKNRKNFVPLPPPYPREKPKDETIKTPDVTTKKPEEAVKTPLNIDQKAFSGRVDEKYFKAKQIFSIADGLVDVTFDTETNYDNKSENTEDKLTIELVFNAKEIPLEDDMVAIGENLIYGIEHLTYEQINDQKMMKIQELQKKIDSEGNEAQKKELQLQKDAFEKIQLSKNGKVVTTNNFGIHVTVPCPLEKIHNHGGIKTRFESYHVKIESNECVKNFLTLIKLMAGGCGASKGTDPKRSMYIMNRTSLGKIFSLMNESDKKQVRDVLKNTQYQNELQLTSLSYGKDEYEVNMDNLTQYFEKFTKLTEKDEALIKEDPTYIAAQKEKFGISALGKRTEKLGEKECPIFEFRDYSYHGNLEKFPEFLQSIADEFWSEST